jgi:hypothetical protein
MSQMSKQPTMSELLAQISTGWDYRSAKLPNWRQSAQYNGITRIHPRLATMSPFILSLFVGLMALLLASGVMQQRTLDKWTRDTGRAPMIHTGRGSWHRYLRSVEAEISPSVSRKIAFWGWVGKLSIGLMWALVALEGVARCH